MRQTNKKPSGFVLLVDDNDIGRYARARVMRAADLEVHEASTGAEGLRCISLFRPEVVVLDVCLPDMDGFTLCRRIKDDPANASIQVLHVTASALTASERIRGLEAADSYLMEPVDPEVLVAHVRALLRTHRILRQQRENQARLEIALESANLTTWEMDLVSRVVSASETACRIFGVEPAAADPADWASKLHQEDQQRLMQEFTSALEGKSEYDTEYRLVRPDGVAWVAAKARVLRDENGRPSKMIGVLQDITERKSGEIALHESEARERARAAELQAIMDAVPIATFVSRDAACRTMFGSRASHELLRVRPGGNLSMSAEDPAERPSKIRAMRNEEEIPASELPVQKAASTGEAVRNYDFDLVYDDGSARHLVGDAVPLLDEEGRPAGAVGAFMDITERKRMEEHLRYAQKMESIGVLAGGIAHDFNNLLTSILGNASLIADATDTDDPVSRYAQQVIMSGERAAALTRQLLAYAGKGRFVLASVNLADTVREMALLLRGSVPATIDIRYHLEQDLPAVEADPGQMQQIVMNLVLNAAEAIGECGGAIDVHVGAVDVAAVFTGQAALHLAPGRYVQLEVRDTGCGMDAATAARIFEPFFTTKFTGRGLGLSAVQGIVRAHNGAIRVHSHPARGSQFSVLLPATGASAPGEAHAPAEMRECFGQGLILIADDEEPIRSVAKATLEKLGYTVLLASDGEEAVRVFAEAPDRFSAVLLDMTMPVLSGEATLMRLREIRPDIPVVISSGYGEAEVIRRFSAHELAGFIGKPYPAALLGQKIKAACAGREVRRLAAG